MLLRGVAPRWCELYICDSAVRGHRLLAGVAEGGV